MHCQMCGTKLPPEGTTCPNCGAQTPYNVSTSDDPNDATIPYVDYGPSRETASPGPQPQGTPPQTPFDPGRPSWASRNPASTGYGPGYRPAQPPASPSSQPLPPAGPQYPQPPFASPQQQAQQPFAGPQQQPQQPAWSQSPPAEAGPQQQPPSDAPQQQPLFDLPQAQSPAAGSQQPAPAGPQQQPPFFAGQQPFYAGPQQQPPFFAGQQPFYAGPQQQPFVGQQLPPAGPQAQQRRRFPAWATALIVGLVILLIIGSGFILYAAVFQPNQLHAQATATAQANVTSTAQARVNATGTAQGAIAAATAHAQATATALPNLYLQATSGTPALNSSLKGQDFNAWDVFNSNGVSCAFKGGAYHVSQTQQGPIVACTAETTNFSNFAYQVQMTIVKGDVGGLLFRADLRNSKGYILSISQSGAYLLLVFTQASNGRGQQLLTGSSSAINTGPNQSNLIAVIARNSSIYLFINKQFVGSVSDSNITSGQIGVIGQDEGSPTDVAYSNAQVWPLS